MYFLERKTRVALPNVLGNHNFPVHTYQWKQVAACEKKGPLEAMIPAGSQEHRIVSNNPELPEVEE